MVISGQIMLAEVEAGMLKAYLLMWQIGKPHTRLLLEQAENVAQMGVVPRLLGRPRRVVSAEEARQALVGMEVQVAAEAAVRMV